MTNNTIIALAVLENKLMSKTELVNVINETGDLPFHSFNEWKARGYRVKKGEHGVFKAALWQKTNYSEEQLKEKNKDSNWFYLVSTSLFSREQVELAKEEKKFPISEKTKKELKENGISLTKNSPKAKAKTVSTKVEKTEAKADKSSKKTSVKATKKLENTNKAKAVKNTKKVTKKAETGVMTSTIEDGIEIIRIDLTKEDGNKAWIKLTKDFYMGLSKTKKRELEKVWGLA